MDSIETVSNGDHRHQNGINTNDHGDLSISENELCDDMNCIEIDSNEKEYNKQTSNKSNHDEEFYESERKDTVPDLDEDNDLDAGIVTNENVQVAFKRWYRKASTGKSFTKMRAMSDIPISSGSFLSDENIEVSKSDPQSSHSRGVLAEQELQAISRRLSVNDAATSGYDAMKLRENGKKACYRKGSVPIIRTIQGTVKDRLATFENK